MFTGIIETLGTIRELQFSGTNKIFLISSPITPELFVDQSVSHDGVCLTVEEILGDTYQVTAIRETLAKTRLSQWEPGDQVNLERCLKIDGRLDGHIVQGHVDTTAVCRGSKEINGSWEFRFEFPGEFSGLVIEKGSISLNGISLTVFDVKRKSFSVAIIPYTYAHTNIKSISKGSLVNIEFDIIGKYILRQKSLRS
jgi:riboflavin synthase